MEGILTGVIVGVIVGWVSTRWQSRRWLQELKLQSYPLVLDTAYAVLDDCRAVVRDWNDPASFQTNWDKLYEELQGFDRSAHRSTFFSHQHVRERANEVAEHLWTVAETLRDSRSGPAPDLEALLPPIRDALDSFRMAARREIKLVRR